MYICSIITYMKFYKPLVVVMAAVLVAITAMATTTTNSNDDNKNKYSLKHLSKLSNNYLSFQLRYRTSQVMGNYFYTRDANGLSMSGPVTTDLFSQKSSSTTFVYPYKFTPKVPKFKTPARP